MPEQADLPLLEADKLNPPLNPTLITEASQLYRVADFLRRVSVIGYDLETNMADDFSTRVVRTIQVGDRNEQYVIDLLPFAGSTEELKQQGHRKMPGWAGPIMYVLESALCSDSHVKVGHNLQFEYECMRWGFGLRTWSFYDTMLAEKVLHAGSVSFFVAGFWAMDDLVARYCKKQLCKDEQTGFNLEMPLRPEQVIYAALDTRVPLVLKACQEKPILQAGLSRAVRIENECIPAVGDMRISGMLLDTAAWLRIVESTEGEHAVNVKELDKHFLPVVGGKDQPLVDLKPLEDAWRGEKDKEKRKLARQAYQAASKLNKTRDKDALDWEGEAALNYSSDSQILAALHKYGFTKQELPASHDKLLRKFDKDPAVAALRKYRGTKKVLDSFGRDFLKWIDPVTGRIHATVNQLGADTGRTSARKPNNQQTPKQQRSCFIAKPGYSLITTDFSGAELRIIAELSQDKTWIEAFANDWDVHSISAQMMNATAWAAATEDGCAFAAFNRKCSCKGHKELRNNSKTVSFGNCYGQEAYALADALQIGKQAAITLLQSWRTANAAVQCYLEKSGNDAKMRMEARTLSGRRRIFKKPNWDACRELALSRWADQGRSPADFTDKQISKIYANMYGSVEREGKNTPIQGLQADIAKVAMSLIWHELPKYSAELQAFVHDEYLIECPTECAEACRDMVALCIRKAGAEFMTKVTMESEAHLGPRWEKG